MNVVTEDIVVGSGQGAIETTITKWDAETMIRLRALLLSFREWNTRLTKSAYRKGVDAAIAEADGTNPYTVTVSRGSNHMSGANNPEKAWAEGVRDGRRIRDLMTAPSQVFPEISWREAKIVGYDQKRRVE